MKEHSHNTALTWGFRGLGLLIMFIGFVLASSLLTLPCESNGCHDYEAFILWYRYGPVEATPIFVCMCGNYCCMSIRDSCSLFW